MLSLHKRALVQEWNPISFICEFIESPKEVVPCRVVRAGMDRIDGEDFPIVRVGKKRTPIFAYEVGA